MKRLFIAIDKWSLPALLLLSLVLFISSIYEAVTADPNLSFFKSGVRILTLDSEPDGSVLYFNFAFNLTIAWAAFKVYTAAVGLKWDNFYARHFLKNHIVILAGNIELDPTDEFIPTRSKVDLSFDLAEALASSQRVVLVVPAISDEKRSSLWLRGVTIIEGRDSVDGALEAARIDRAARLIAMCDDFNENLALSWSALSWKGGNPELQCRCMTDPLSYKRNFKPETFFDKSTLPRVRLFNEAEIAARLLLTEFPPDASVAQTSEKVEILLIGMTLVSEALIELLARIGHYRNGERPKITIVDSDAQKSWDVLLHSWPVLYELVEAEPLSADLESLNAQQLNLMFGHQRSFTGIYVCHSHEIANLRLARMLADWQDGASPDVFRTKIAVHDPSGGVALKDYTAGEQYGDRIHRFSTVSLNEELGQSPFVRSLIDHTEDSRAKALHEAYRASSNTSGAGAASWEELDETYRDANRRVIDHFDIKLRAIGCRLSQNEDVEEVEITTDELELLARMEHSRWCADRLLAGWTYGELRDDVRYEHPSLMHYEKLPESEKQKDRDAVVMLFSILRAEGTRVVRDAN